MRWFSCGVESPRRKRSSSRSSGWAFWNRLGSLSESAPGAWVPMVQGYRPGASLHPRVRQTPDLLASRLDFPNQDPQFTQRSTHRLMTLFG